MREGWTELDSTTLCEHYQPRRHLVQAANLSKPKWGATVSALATGFSQHSTQQKHTHNAKRWPPCKELLWQQIKEDVSIHSCTSGHIANCR